MKKIIIGILLFLCGCSNNQSNHYVALYKDNITNDAILSIFPSFVTEVAMNTCQSTVDLYKRDDKEKMASGFSTGTPEYYCQEISTEDLKNYISTNN